MNSQSKNEQEGMDRISALPDVLIGHILSFLPTRYAVCTTVLSTRWNNLWRSLPNLDFYDKDFSEKTKDFYMKFVDSVLSSRGSLDIRKLTIDFEHSEEANAEDLSRVLEWICAAIRHNVVDLDVSPWFKNRKPVWRDDGPKLKLPLSLLKCKTLEVFTLYSNCIAYPTTPTRGCFPNLKALSVKLPHGDFDSLDSLLSYLPVLEELTFDATYVSYINVLNMKICAPLLKTLRILLKYLNGIYMSPNNFFISAPKLEKVKLTDGVLTNYFLESTKCLERFEIAYMDRMVNHNIGDGSNNEAPRFAKRAAGLLEKCCHVKYLSLDTRPKCLEVLFGPK